MRISRYHSEPRNIVGGGTWSPPYKTTEPGLQLEVRSLNVGCGVRIRNVFVGLDLFKNGNSNGRLVSNGCRDGRRSRGPLPLVLALNETVGDAKDRVDNNGIDAFRNLVLQRGLADGSQEY